MSGQFKQWGQEYFRERRYELAVQHLALAVESFPNEEQLWFELVLSASLSKQHEIAAKFAKQAIQHHPRSDWLWRQLGSELIALDKLEEAEKVLENAKTLNSRAPGLWHILAKLHHKRKDYAKEIEAWDNLGDLMKASR